MQKQKKAGRNWQPGGAMKTLDLRRKYKHLYQPSAKAPALVDIPEFSFVMIDGRIEKGKTPGNSPAFQEAMTALYGAAYTLKFMSKLRKTGAINYPVMALEAIWWVEDGVFDIRKPDNWSWRAMILQPDHITPEMFAEALDQLWRKKPGPGIGKLRLERYCEGLCVQIMHIGPYAAEPATVDRLRAFAAENGRTERHDRAMQHGSLQVFDHHELYLGDPRRSAPEKLRTVLRHPVA
jgi:hypothetical protein